MRRITLFILGILVSTAAGAQGVQCLPCPEGMFSNGVWSSCKDIDKIVQSEFDTLKYTATAGACMDVELEPGLYRVVLEGGKGGYGSAGDRGGGAGGGGGKMTYNFIVSKKKQGKLCAGANGGNAGGRAKNRDAGCKSGSYWYLGYGGGAGTPSYLDLGIGSVYVAGGGSGGGGGGGWCTGDWRHSDYHKSGYASGGSPNVTLDGITYNVSAPGVSSPPNQGGYTGNTGGVSPGKILVDDVQSCSGPCAKIYKMG
jgi:hypothetical protein